jgi:hypothetical protein
MPDEQADTQAMRDRLLPADMTAQICRARHQALLHRDAVPGTITLAWLRQRLATAISGGALAR